MRKTIFLILIFILSANPTFAFNQATPLAPSLLLPYATSEETSGHLGGVNSLTYYAYDGEDIILESRVTSAPHLRGGAKPLLGGGDGSYVNRYVHGPGVDEPISVSVIASPPKAGEAIYYYHYNGQGSVIALTDKSGRVIQSYNYDSFGNIIYPFWQRIDQPYTYTGREYDRETGLYYYRNRYYDPKVGRFLTPDPIGFAGGMNLYGYVKNNPVNYTDPRGWCAEPVSIWEDPLFAPIGAIWGARLIGLGLYAGLYAGENAVLYSGPGMRALAAASAGMPIFKTFIGGAMNWVENIGIKFPRIVWDAASAIYTSTARGTIRAFISESAGYNSTFARVEAPIVALLESLGKAEMVFK